PFAAGGHRRRAGLADRPAGAEPRGENEAPAKPVDAARSGSRTRVRVPAPPPTRPPPDPRACPPAVPAPGADCDASAPRCAHGDPLGAALAPDDDLADQLGREQAVVDDPRRGGQA